MKAINAAPASVSEYVADFPKTIRIKLKELRRIIRENAPDAEESLSYKMPYYSLHGRLLYFAGYQHHIGLYPMASAIIHFKEEIEKYKHARGSVQFPLDQPLPTALIRKIVVFRVKENKAKNAIKNMVKKANKRMVKPAS